MGRSISRMQKPPRSPKRPAVAAERLSHPVVSCGGCRQRSHTALRQVSLDLCYHGRSSRLRCPEHHLVLRFLAEDMVKDMDVVLESILRHWRAAAPERIQCSHDETNRDTVTLIWF